MNLQTLDWDQSLLDAFEIPKHTLPKILNSCDDFGVINYECGMKGIEITGCLGDQQAASLGHGLFDVGHVKNTYGTGVFLMINTGEQLLNVPGLITTVCFKLGKESKTVYALEGAIECGGATINWMKDKLELFKSYDEIDDLVATTTSNGGVYFIPAFCGLYSPEWRQDATGLISGLTNFAGKAHIVRACLEAICYRTRDVIECVRKNSDLKIDQFKVDGGLTVNKFLMEFQANLLQKTITKSKVKNATGFGVGLAAALHAKVYQNLDDIKDIFKSDDVIGFDAQRNDEFDTYYKKWTEVLPKSFN